MTQIISLIKLAMLCFHLTKKIIAIIANNKMLTKSISTFSLVPFS